MCAPIGDPVKTHFKQTPDPNPRLYPVQTLAYSVEEAAVALGIGRTSVFYLLRDGLLKPIKIGRRTLIPLTEIQAFIRRMQGV